MRHLYLISSIGVFIVFIVVGAVWWGDIYKDSVRLTLYASTLGAVAGGLASGIGSYYGGIYGAKENFVLSSQNSKKRIRKAFFRQLKFTILGIESILQSDIEKISGVMPTLDHNWSIDIIEIDGLSNSEMESLYIWYLFMTQFYHLSMAEGSVRKKHIDSDEVKDGLAKVKEIINKHDQ